MVVHVQRSYRSFQSFYENEIVMDPRTIGTDAINIFHIDRTHSTHHEMHNDVTDLPSSCHIDLTLPAYHEIHHHARGPIAFDETSLPSYESAVNWSVQRQEVSVPIPASSECTSNQPQEQSKCCRVMKHIVIAAPVMIVCTVCIFLIVFFIEMR